MEEIWKSIVWYEWLYEVSSLGRVKSTLNKYKILKPRHTQWNYSQVDLYKKNKRNSIYVHRLVALTFIPNPENKPFVCHKNEKLTDWLLNNSVDNLWWWTRSENMVDCFKKWRANNHLQLNHPKPTLWKFWKEHPRSRTVLQYSKELILINEYESIKDASFETWIIRQNISACCLWKTKTAWWFIWRFL